MIQVIRKDPQEANENLIRRFTRKVQQSGLLPRVKGLQYFERPLSKRDRRSRAIIRKARKADKLMRLRLGR